MWAHMGTAESPHGSELVCLAAEDLQGAMQKCPEAKRVVVDYCIRLHSFLLQPGMRLTDMPSAIDYQELMLRLLERSRQVLLDGVLHKLEDEDRSWGGFMSRVKSFDTLRAEIKQGKCLSVRLHTPHSVGRLRLVCRCVWFLLLQIQIEFAQIYSAARRAHASAALLCPHRSRACSDI